jgi:hypothetical protein
LIQSTWPTACVMISYFSFNMGDLK